MALGGLLWFDYLGVVRVKTVFTPLYKLMGKTPQTSETASSSKPILGDIDQERLNRQRESLDLYKEELDRREAEISHFYFFIFYISYLFYYLFFYMF